MAPWWCPCQGIQSGNQGAITSDLNNQLTATVDAGGDKLIVDLSAVEEPTLRMIELVLSVIQAAGDLSLNISWWIGQPARQMPEL